MRTRLPVGNFTPSFSTRGIRRFVSSLLVVSTPVCCFTRLPVGCFTPTLARDRHPSVLSLFNVRSRVRVSTKFSVKTNLPDMKANAHPRPPEGEDNDSEILSVKPSLAVSDGPPPAKKKKKNKDVHAQENVKVEGRREGPFQASSSFSKKKRSKKRQLNTGIDLEELLARTYPKEIPIPMEHAQEMPPEPSSRRSTRKKRRPLKEFGDHAKKWSADEEISIATALLDCTSPDGEFNIAAFYQRAKESLPGEVSNTQLYDKMRNMKKRFRTIQSKLKEQNVPEDEFPYRTRQESALFAIWKQIWGNSVHIREIRAECPKENGTGDLRSIELGSPRKSGDENFREIENENPRVNGPQNFRENRDENLIEIESEIPKQYEREMSEGSEGENPRNNGSDSTRKIDVSNPRNNGSDSTRKINVSNPRASGVDGDQHESEEKEDEEHSPQNSMPHETPNTNENGRFEDTFKKLLDQTEARLQASIANAINRVVSASPTALNFQPFRGFGVESGMDIFLSRKMKELMEDVNSAKEFPGLDAAESQELQRKWQRLKIQELRMFCDSLELLQKQCRLVLKKAETSGSNDNHTS